MERRLIIFRDRPASPLDTAMYWVDHVLEHKDTSYLKSASVRLKWYELYSVDVLGILIFLMGVTFYTLRLVILRFISSVLGLFAKSQKWCNIKSRQSDKKQFKK